MKITPEHYALLKEKLDQAIDKNSIEKILKHRKKYLEKNADMQFRWALFWMILDLSIEKFRIYNDNHIDTALKKYVKEHPVLGKNSN
jgi:hypothetical protein